MEVDTGRKAYYNPSGYPDGIPIDPALTGGGKRRLSRSSPELSPRAAMYRADHASSTLLSTGALSPEAQLRTPASLSGVGAGGSSSRSATGEDSLTLRRREANRLAAQRFRSRKKGYQDSLEEKVRQLEEERDGLLRRLGEAPGVSTFGPPSSAGRSGQGEDGRFGPSPWQSGGPAHGASGRGDGYRRPSFSSQSTSPERREAQDPDLRIASLESANRHLQDELRHVVDENDRLKQELDGWRRWESSQREERERHPDDRNDPRMSYTRTKSGLPSDPHFASHSAPTLHAARTIPPPPLHRAQSFNSPSATTSFSPMSSGFRLPPLRLPPGPPGGITDPEGPHSPGEAYLPRTPALDQPLRDPSPRRDEEQKPIR